MAITVTEISNSLPRVLGGGNDGAGNRTVTGTTSETSVYSLTVPGNAMGPNGVLRVSLTFSYPTSANNKTLRLKFGNSSPLTVTAIVTTTVSTAGIVLIRNMGSNSVQEAHASLIASVGSTSTALVTGANDTQQDQLLEVTIQNASAAESTSLRGILVEVLRF